MSEIITKICTKCLNELPLESFPKHKGSKYGVLGQCKSCVSKQGKENRERHSEKIKEYVAMHSEEIKEYKRKYYQENKEKISKRNKENKSKYDIKAYDKKYREKHKEEINKKAAIRRIEDKERLKETAKKHYEKNKDKIKERKRACSKRPEAKERHVISEQIRRATKKRLDHSFTTGEWNECKKHFNYQCAYCGQVKELTQDHFIALTKGGEYTINNIVPACASCNSSKGNRDFFEWYKNQKTYTKKREQKILKYLRYRYKEQQLALII